jgi:hypothetical protein
VRAFERHFLKIRLLEEAQLHFMTKKIKKVLPAGIAVWPKLNEVDVYQPTDGKGRPSGAEKRRYITNVKFNDEDHRAVDAWLDGILKEFDLEDGKKPWRKDKKTGELTLTATSGEDYRPAVYDAAKQEVPPTVKIGGGSKIKLYVTANPYTGFGGGVNLYINSVQLLELKQRDENPFDEEDGFKAPSKTSPKADEEDRADDTEDEEIPF